MRSVCPPPSRLVSQWIVPAALAGAAAAALAAACAGEVVAPPGDPSLTGPSLSPEMLAALGRDLGESEAQLARRLLAEARAARVAPALAADLGPDFAGMYMSDDGTVAHVAITDAGLADAVRAAGAEPRVVAHSLADLTAFAAHLEAAAPPAAVHAWRVDVMANAITVDVSDPRAPEVAAFLAFLPAGAPVELRVVPPGDRPRPLVDVRGGDEYIINGNTLCSIGFAVHGGFVTAGHCGKAGSPTAGSNWQASGTFRGSIFPGSDMAWVELNSNWNAIPWVAGSGGAGVAVHGSNVAVVNSSICRSGRTTGWRCGKVEAHNVVINYAAGPVYGATQTSACAEGGDSGGSFIAGNQAQGVTSGGSGNCSSGGRTFYQPLGPILAQYGLGLKTTGGGGGGRELVSHMNGKCIDVPGANFVDGAPLQMWSCNGTVAQKWSFEGGTLRAGGKCMDVAWANPANGTAIQLVNCNGNVAQQFVLTGAGDLVSVLANKCVDIGGWNGNDGAKLIIWPCHGGANQKWTAR